MNLISQTIRLWLRRAAAIVAVGLALRSSTGAADNGSQAHGLKSRPGTKPHLLRAARADAAMPQLLSETGAFSDTRELKVSPGLIPYDLIVPFWSDGATKRRWVSVGDGKITFSATGEWTFPKGTVFVKAFKLASNESNLLAKRRLETRLIVCDETGGVYGVTYKWRADNSDADLLTTDLTEHVGRENASVNRD